MSVAVAHADPGFVITESQVRAGDTVHFSITGGEGHVTYEIEVAGRDLLKGSGDGGSVSGQFAMPDLGVAAKRVKVEADIKDSDDKTEVKRKLQYLGLALPVVTPDPPAEPQPAAPAPQQLAAATPAPTSSTPAAAPVTPAQAAQPRSKTRAKTRSRRHTRKRRKEERHRAVLHRSGGQKSEAAARTKKRARRPAVRTAPLFDGVPEPGSENYVPDNQLHATPKKQPVRKPVFGNAVANRASSEAAMAIFIPGALGLIGFLLAGTTVVRRRRTR
jgi:hypothetical protein